MENSNCGNCKYYDGRCENYRLTRTEKVKRLNGMECEYWKEKLQTPQNPTRQALLDIAVELEKIAYSLKDDEE